LIYYVFSPLPLYSILNILNILPLYCHYPSKKSRESSPAPSVVPRLPCTTWLRTTTSARRPHFGSSSCGRTCRSMWSTATKCGTLCGLELCQVSCLRMGI
jgi:hypothetical protein